MTEEIQPETPETPEAETTKAAATPTVAPTTPEQMAEFLNQAWLTTVGGKDYVIDLKTFPRNAVEYMLAKGVKRTFNDNTTQYAKDEKDKEVLALIDRMQRGILTKTRGSVVAYDIGDLAVIEIVVELVTVNDKTVFKGLATAAKQAKAMEIYGKMDESQVKIVTDAVPDAIERLKKAAMEREAAQARKAERVAQAAKLAMGIDLSKLLG